MIGTFGVEYDDCWKWVKNKRDRNKSWKEIRFACKGDESGLQTFLDNKKMDDDWPLDLTVEKWKEMVDEIKRADDEKLRIQRINKAAEIHDPRCETLQFTIPALPFSSWQLYKQHLSENKHFTDDSIQKIEEASFGILKRLSLDTTATGPVKGLVIGNVQSGKTANMAGLMAMAADWGFNMFIVLSGTIENLRIQTQNLLPFYI